MNHSNKGFMVFFLLVFILSFSMECIDNQQCNPYTEPVVNTLSSSIKDGQQLQEAFLTGSFADMGEDLDGDYLFDHIVLFIEINVTQDVPILYTELIIQAFLASDSATPVGREFELSFSNTSVAAGVYNMSIPIIDATSFINLGSELFFEIEQIKLRREHEIYHYLITLHTLNHPYATRTYWSHEFDVRLHFTGEFWDRGEDIDFNWRYDYLIIELGVIIAPGDAGRYYFEVKMVPGVDPQAEGIKSSNRTFLDEGKHIISVKYEAALLHRLKINGSLIIIQIKAYDKNNSLISYFNPNYVTKDYFFDDFDVDEIRIDGKKELVGFIKTEKLLGSGTYGNPYIISGFVIRGSFSWNLISIENVDDYIQITDNVLHGGEIGIYLNNLRHCLITNNKLQQNKIGIHLKDVKDCIISQNSISKQEKGLVLEEAVGNVIEYNSFNENSESVLITEDSNNNVFANNSISTTKKKDETAIGLLIDEDSQSNLIVSNDFHDNDLNAYDSGLNNIFLSNYWSDWTGEGYYWIPGEHLGTHISSKNRDPSPAIMSNHIIQPIIFKPLGGETIFNPVIVITWDAKDNLDHSLTFDLFYSAVEMTLNHPSDWILIRAGIKEKRYEWNVRNITSGLSIRLKIVARDSLGFISWEFSDIFTIQTPINPTPVISPLFGTFLLLIVCIGLLVKFT
ncbi:MAG: NosD domain-containing protein [Promethearchaeota archaeon]